MAVALPGSSLAEEVTTIVEAFTWSDFVSDVLQVASNVRFNRLGGIELLDRVDFVTVAVDDGIDEVWLVVGAVVGNRCVHDGHVHHANFVLSEADVVVHNRPRIVVVEFHRHRIAVVIGVHRNPAVDVAVVILDEVAIFTFFGSVTSHIAVDVKDVVVVVALHVSKTQLGSGLQDPRRTDPLVFRNREHRGVLRIN